MPIPDLPLFRHRETVVTPTDQNQFVTQFENTMDTLSNGVIPAMNDAIVDINEKVITTTTVRDEAVSARNIAVAAKNEALTAVATLQEGAINDTIIAPNKAFSNQFTNNNFVKLTGNQTIAGVKTFSSSPIVPTPTDNTQAANKAYTDLKVALSSLTGINQSLTESGYQKFPGGLIIQWGSAITGASGGSTITYPIAFPNSFLSLVLGSNVSSNEFHTFQAQNRANFFLQSWISNTGAPSPSKTVFYIAIGY